MTAESMREEIARIVDPLFGKTPVRGWRTDDEGWEETLRQHSIALAKADAILSRLSPAPAPAEGMGDLALRNGQLYCEANARALILEAQLRRLVAALREEEHELPFAVDGSWLDEADAVLDPLPEPPTPKPEQGL